MIFKFIKCCKENTIFNYENSIKQFLNSIDAKLPVPNHIETDWDNLECKENNSISYLKDSGECWYLGYSSLSIIPPDIEEKKYYIGGNIAIPPRKIKGIIDDIKVRTICLSVNKDGQKTILSCIDCIGITSFYVNIIRDELSDYCITNNIKYINIFSTHTHSSVDTMGIWSVTSKKLISNFGALKREKNPSPSVDTEFMRFLIDRIKESIRLSVEDQKPGTLLFAQIGEISADKIREQIYHKIGFDPKTDVWNKNWEKLSNDELSKIGTSKLGVYEYILAKRSPYEYLPCVTKLRFKPYDISERETQIVNLSAHPYSNGLKIKNQWKGNMLSGDFPFYMEKVFNENGYNFMFLNGAINGIYPKRESTKVGTSNQKTPIKKQTETIGLDWAGIALSIDMHKTEIYDNPTINPTGRSNVYRRFIENKNGSISEQEIIPNLFEAKKNTYIKCTNNLEKIIGKLNFSQHIACVSKSNELHIKSEVGYIQLGDSVKIALLPGEITPGLLTGKGDMIPKNTLNKTTIDFECIADIFGGNTLVFGLANDAIGYIIPDNDYCMLYLGNGILSKKIFGSNYTHYQELFSLGENVASILMRTFKELKGEIDKAMHENS